MEVASVQDTTGFAATDGSPDPPNGRAKSSNVHVSTLIDAHDGGHVAVSEATAAGLPSAEIGSGHDGSSTLLPPALSGEPLHRCSSPSLLRASPMTPLAGVCTFPLAASFAEQLRYVLCDYADFQPFVDY
jgi:hypothetical protein